MQSQELGHRSVQHKLVLDRAGHAVRLHEDAHAARVRPVVRVGLAWLEHGLELQEGTGVDEAAGERVRDREGLADSPAGAAGARDVEVDGVETVVGLVGGGVAGVDVLGGGVGGGRWGAGRQVGAGEGGAAGVEGPVGRVGGGGVGGGCGGGGGGSSAGVEDGEVHVLGVGVGDLLDAGMVGHGGGRAGLRAACGRCGKCAG